MHGDAARTPVVVFQKQGLRLDGEKIPYTNNKMINILVIQVQNQ